jgi:hypothetical protein
VTGVACARVACARASPDGTSTDAECRVSIPPGMTRNRSRAGALACRRAPLISRLNTAQPMTESALHTMMTMAATQTNLTSSTLRLRIGNIDGVRHRCGGCLVDETRCPSHDQVNSASYFDRGSHTQVLEPPDHRCRFPSSPVRQCLGVDVGRGRQRGSAGRGFAPKFCGSPTRSKEGALHHGGEQCSDGRLFRPLRRCEPTLVPPRGLAVLGGT